MDYNDKDYSEPEEPRTLFDRETGEAYIINAGGYRIPKDPDYDWSDEEGDKD